MMNININIPGIDCEVKKVAYFYLITDKLKRSDAQWNWILRK